MTHEPEKVLNATLNKAIEVLAGSDYTCVLCKNNEILTSKQRGIAPLLAWHDSDATFAGFSAADKVIGKGAAFLYVLLGVQEVYAPVISEVAVATLEKHEIIVRYETLVPYIVNRTGDGGCPIEQAVMTTEEPEEALIAIKQRLAELSNQSS